MKINATSRLSATSITAEFTPEQKEVFQKIDTLRRAMKFPTFNFYANWNPHGGKVTKQFEVLIDALVSALHPVNSIAILGLVSGSPTEFGRAYKYTNQRELTRAAVGPKYERVINDALAEVKKMQKPNDPARQYLEFIAEIYPLLTKSWSFLLKEVKKEYMSLSED